MRCLTKAPKLYTVFSSNHPFGSCILTPQRPQISFACNETPPSPSRSAASRDGNPRGQRKYHTISLRFVTGSILPRECERRSSFKRSRKRYACHAQKEIEERPPVSSLPTSLLPALPRRGKRSTRGLVTGRTEHVSPQVEGLRRGHVWCSLH